MRKSLVKEALIPLVAAFVLSLLLSACKKPMPKAYFDYRIESGPYYATCRVSNYSVNADSYEWTLTRPNGTCDNSNSVEPSFRCYDVGTYNITVYASNQYGMDRSTTSFNIYHIGNGNDNGGDNGDDNNPTAVAYTIKWLRLEKIPMLALAFLAAVTPTSSLISKILPIQQLTIRALQKQMLLPRLCQ